MEKLRNVIKTKVSGEYMISEEFKSQLDLNFDVQKKAFDYV